MSQCRACGGFLIATLVDEDIYECANCGTKRDFSDPDDLEVDK